MPIRIVQMTDPHLFADPSKTLMGLQTQFSFERVLEKVNQEQTDIDVVLLTGDIAQDGSVDAYQRVKDYFLAKPYNTHWLPGNHDNVDNMVEVAKNSSLESKVVDVGAWRILLLNSAVKNKVLGNFSQEELQWLKEQLADSNKPTLITFHHHPIKMNSDWIDTQMIQNADEFLSIVHQHKQVKCLLWGHVHQESRQTIKGVEYISTPSSCFQFTPKQTDYEVDKLAPGYRWLTLNEDGTIDSGVSRVEGVDFEIDYSIKGY